MTRGRGVSIHRTDCVNILNLPEVERTRLIDAEWQVPEGAAGERYMAELALYAKDRIGLLADISRVMAEEEITITSLNSRTNKQGTATFNISFETAGVQEINHMMARLRQIEGVVDIQRAIG